MTLEEAYNKALKDWEQKPNNGIWNFWDYFWNNLNWHTSEDNIEEAQCYFNNRNNKESI